MSELFSSNWQQHALCIKPDIDPEIFTPQIKGKDLIRKEASAIEICRICPVADLCYDEAIRLEANSGVWGGVNFGAKRDRIHKQTVASESFRQALSIKRQQAS